MTSRIEQQIKEQMEKAWMDVISEAVSSDPPNYEYIVRLYAEIRDRLAGLVPKNGPTYHRIRDTLDVDFFDQLLRHNCFSGESLVGLINSTFDIVAQLQAPVHDATTLEAKQRVLSSGQTLAEVVPVFLRETHKRIDVIVEDIKTLRENADHPLVKHLLSSKTTQ